MCGSCPGAKRAGVMKKQLAEKPLPGSFGMALIEYRGKERLERFSPSVITGGVYWYGTERPCFYIDERDLGRLFGWRENGGPVFFEANGNAGTV